MSRLNADSTLSSLGVDSEDTRTAVRRVITVVPTFLATYWRYRQYTEPVRSREDLRHATNYL